MGANHPQTVAKAAALGEDAGVEQLAAVGRQAEDAPVEVAAGVERFGNGRTAPHENGRAARNNRQIAAKIHVAPVGSNADHHQLILRLHQRDLVGADAAHLLPVPVNNADGDLSAAVLASLHNLGRVVGAHAVGAHKFALEGDDLFGDFHRFADAHHAHGHFWGEGGKQRRIHFIQFANFHARFGQQFTHGGGVGGEVEGLAVYLEREGNGRCPSLAHVWLGTARQQQQKKTDDPFSGALPEGVICLCRCGSVNHAG